MAALDQEADLLVSLIFGGALVVDRVLIFSCVTDRDMAFYMVWLCCSSTVVLERGSISFFLIRCFFE